VADDDEARRAMAATIDTTVPNPARVGDYLYGGRNNFEADRKVARAMLATAPIVGTLAPAMRAFHQRAVRFLVAEVGIRQFLDIGTGLSDAGNTHEVAQSLDSRCRIVYADSDPVVLAHARALMVSTPEGVTRCIDADVRKPSAVIAGAAEILDFSRPVGVLLLATLTFIADHAEAAAVVSALRSAMRSGSYLVVYHQASDLSPALVAACRRWNHVSSRRVTLRSRDEIADLVRGLDLIPPGLVPICEWRPEASDPRFEDLVPVHALVARRP
jgi:hypothetical protein